MRLWSKIKMRLLMWLLGNICHESTCEKCVANYADYVDVVHSGCGVCDVILQARKVWGLEE